LKIFNIPNINKTSASQAGVASFVFNSDPRDGQHIVTTKNLRINKLRKNTMIAIKALKKIKLDADFNIKKYIFFLEN
jgi:hypothetical protein